MRTTLSCITAAAALFGGAQAEVGAAEQRDPRIGEEESRICFARNINGWKALKGVDDVVLLETGVNDWHYVELQGYCPSRIFRSAEFIGIDSRPAGGCVTRGDAILVREFSNRTNRCYINGIYKWDDRRLTPEENAEATPTEE